PNPPAHCHTPHRHLPSFPTRRSSDLPATLNDSNCQRPQRGNHILKTWDLVMTLWKFFVSSGRKLHMSRQECSLACEGTFLPRHVDRKSTRLNSSHVAISYAVFCLKKK